MSTPSPPDVNTEVHPYSQVQHWIDQTTDFCFFAKADPAYSETASIQPGKPADFFGINGGYGITFLSHLHGLSSTPRSGSGSVEQVAGKRVGRLRARCLFGPDDLPWAPLGEPEPRIYDPFRSRRFTMNEVEFELGGESCRAYGIGRTYPQVIDGLPVTLVGGVGNVMSAGGRFSGLEGTFVMTGIFTAGLGFEGNVTLRMVDPHHRLRSGRQIETEPGGRDPDPASRFWILRGEKKDRSVKTTFGPPRNRELSLVTPSQMRATIFSCREQGCYLQTQMKTGPVVAGMLASVYFDLMAPPGTPLMPVPFSTEEVYTFHSADGRQSGTILAEVRDGVSFALRFPDAADQPAVRFAGFGPITGGTGCFQGARGTLTVNSLIGINPHALSLLHVLHVFDPERRRLIGPIHGRKS